jgi:hypothetical protein
VAVQRGRDESDHHGDPRRLGGGDLDSTSSDFLRDLSAVHRHSVSESEKMLLNVLCFPPTDRRQHKSSLAALTAGAHPQPKTRVRERAVIVISVVPGRSPDAQQLVDGKEVRSLRL